MPWTHGGDYLTLNKAELKDLLKLRQLPCSGTKGKLVSRLNAHDDKHPFPFQQLPPELRNKIYTLASTSKDRLISEDLDQPIRGHTEGIRCYNSFRNVMIHSSLFRVSKQTRREGLAMFYQLHTIQLSVEHGGCYLAILLWLRNIGNIGRNNIRFLQVNYEAKVCVGDGEHMENLNRMLSNQASIVYVAVDGLVLWWIGYVMWLRKGTRAPLFNISGMKRGAGLVHETLQNYRLPPRWQSYAMYDWVRYSLTFRANPV